MKKFNSVLAIVLIIALVSLKSDGYILMKEGKKIEVKEENPRPRIFASESSRGAYDLTFFTWTLDTSGTLTFKERGSGNKPDQDEIGFDYVYGDLNMQNDELHATLKGYKKYIYVIKIAQHSVVDSFTNSIELTLGARTVNNITCPFWYLNRGSHFNIVAMPENGDIEDLWKAKHNPAYCSDLTKFEIVDSKGKKGIYGSGDWCIISADRFVELKE